MEFAIECSEAFNTIERKFTNALHKRYLLKISFWIKMLLCEKGIMNLQSDSLAA